MKTMLSLPMNRACVAAWGILLSLVLCAANLCAQNKVVRLYDGPAPGSETWTHQERETPRRVSNVVMKKQNLPTDDWIQRFADWLDLQGLLKK